MLTAEKLSLLAGYLSRRTRAFHEVQHEFRQNFCAEEYAAVTKLIARFLSTCPFENEALSTEKILSAQNHQGEAKAEEKSQETATSPRSPHYFSIEHAYAAVLLAVADSAHIVSATELAKIEQMLKERLIKRAVFSGEASDADPMSQPYHYLKLLWLCGAQIPHGLLSFSGNEFFALPADRLEPYFAALRSDATQRVLTVHPTHRAEPLLGIHLKEGGFLSHATVMQVLAQVQAAESPQYADYQIEFLTAPKLSGAAIVDYLIEGNTSAADSRVRGAFPDSSDYLICMRLLQKGSLETLDSDHTEFIVSLLFASPENIHLFGITPLSLVALLESNNTRLAGAILRIFACTPSLPCFLAPFFDVANHSENAYQMLHDLAAAGLLSEQYLVQILQAGFAAFATECACLSEFTEANERFCVFSTDLLKIGALSTGEVGADVCRYCTLHQCAPKAVELFVTLQSCTTVV